MAVTLLDLIATNPLSRLPQSTTGARQWSRLHIITYCKGREDSI